MTELPTPPTDEKIKEGANQVLTYALFHLVKELREAGIQSKLHDMPVAVKSILNNAMFGAIAELKCHLPENWAADWEQESRAQTMFRIFGEAHLTDALKEVNHLRENPAGNEFCLCGMYAVRNLMEALSEGVERDEWLEQYEGMFASMARMFEVIT